jgi:hypothetical protein
MFQKLARAAVFAASLILVTSRIFSVQLPARFAEVLNRTGAGDSVCIVSQLPARRA